MQMTAIGRAVLASREGVRLRAYKDSVGVWTIGIGHTAAAGAPAPKAGMTITADECDRIFVRDLGLFEQAIAKALKVPVADHEFDALVSLAFNVGAHGAANSTIIKKLNAKDRIGAAKAFLNWKRPPEIVSRREAEMDQFMVPYSVALPKARRSDARPAKAKTSKPAIAPPAPAKDAAQPPKPLLTTYQQRLKDLGFYGMKVDGLWGAGTSGAIGAFKHANGLSGENTFDPEMVALLMSDEAKAKTVSEERANATAADIREEAPIVRKAERGETAAVVQAVVPAAGGLAWYASQAVEYLQPVREFLEDVPVGVWVGGVVAIAAYLWWQSRQIKEARVAMHRTAEVA